MDAGQGWALRFGTVPNRTSTHGVRTPSPSRIGHSMLDRLGDAVASPEGFAIVLLLTYGSVAIMVGGIVWELLGVGL